MNYKLRRREDVDPLCPLKKCCCFDLRMGTFIGGITVFFTTLLQWVLVILDQVSWDSNGKFEIPGSFFTLWRRQFWKGFVACNIVMIICHMIIVFLSGLLIISIFMPSYFKLYRLHPVLMSWWILMVMYILTELGVSSYIYSWYGLAGWRLPYLIFMNMFNIIRFVLNVLFCVVVWSYDCEIQEELDADYNPDGDSVEDLYLNQGYMNGGDGYAEYTNYGADKNGMENPYDIPLHGDSHV